MPLPCSYYTSEIPILEAQIAIYNTAITEAAAGGVASYSFDSGQTTQTVTRRNLKSVIEAKNALESQLSIAYGMRDGTNVSVGGMAN